MNRAIVPAGLVVLVFVLGVWPWLPMVDVFPHGSDATKWVQYSHPTTPTWAEYVFQSRHFVGYRPVAALTYTIDGWISGYEPWAYRLTDIGLHALVGVLLWAVYRRLTGDGSAWGWIAPLVFYLHPAAEDVVPHLARRSYSLSCVLALGAILAFAEAARRPERPWSRWTWIGTMLLVMGLLSNEVAGVVLAGIPLLMLHLRPEGAREPRWSALLPAVPSLLAALGLLVVRWRILGDATGGYQKRYFAYTLHDKVMLAEVGDTPYAQVLGAAWRYALFPTSASGAQALLLDSAPGLAVAAAIVLFYGGCVVVASARGWDRPRERLPGVLFVWMFGYALLYALTRNWFWRQCYPMLLPLALAVAAIASAWWRVTDRRMWVASWAPQLALLASLAWHSPVFRGLNTSVLGGPMKMSAVIEALADQSRAIDGPATVWLVLPTRAGNAHMVRIWTEKLLGRNRIDFKLLAVSEPTAHVDVESNLLRVRDPEGRPRLELPKGITWAEGVEEDLKLGGAREVFLDRLHRRGTQGRVFGRQRGTWVMIEVPKGTGAR